MVEETVTVEEDPGTPTSHVSIVTSEDGTTRRTETKVGALIFFPQNLGVEGGEKRENDVPNTK